MPPGLVCLYTLEDGEGKIKDDEGLSDVVAVHGLNEDSIDAWTDTETGINWLSDLLPTQIRVARVLAYGYDGGSSTFLREGISMVIQRSAEWLVQELCADRMIAGRQKRPIIFLCHGIGGIIVKKSLAYSSTRTGQKVEHLWDHFASTYAILIFGTPHKRIRRSDWMAVQKSMHSKSLRRLLKDGPLSHQPKNDVIDIESITSDFLPLMKSFHIFCFCEEEKAAVGDKRVYLVPRTAAVLDGEHIEKAGIQGDHYSMVKFTSESASSYRTVVEALTRYCTNGPSIIATRWEQAAPTLSRMRTTDIVSNRGIAFDIHTPGADDHSMFSSAAVSNINYYPPEEAALDFVGREDMLQRLEHAFFPGDQANLEDSRKSFVVYGIGGSGKTQLCCTFAQRSKHRYTNVFTIHAASKETIVESYSFIAMVGKLEANERAGRHFLSQLAEPWLLIIDNADDLTLDLRTLFPQSRGVHILVTTRNPDFRKEGSLGAMESSGLKEIEALQLLLRKADIPEPWDSLTIKSANTIAQTLGYLALALIHAGNCIYRKICRIGDYLSLHAISRENLRNKVADNMLKDEQDTVRKIYSTFAVSLDYLRKHSPSSSPDINAMLNIASFLHFESIPVDIFTRAVKYRRQALVTSAPKDLGSTIVQAVVSRLEPPKILPDFLKGDPRKMNHYRVTQAISALHSFSLVAFDGRFFSLHPLVHAWIRDSMSDSERAYWQTISLNTLFESIQLPPIGDAEADRAFHRSISQHLDHINRERQPNPENTIYGLSNTRLLIAKICQPTMIMLLREQVLQSAKCGYVLATLGHFQPAVQHLSDVKTALVSILGTKHDKTLTATLALAGVLWGLTRIEEAIALQRLVVDTRTKLLGDSHQDTLQAMDHLGKSYWLHGMYREALSLQEITVERARKTLSPTHPLFLSALDNLGSTLGSWHRFSESEDAHREVYQSRLAALGESHIDTIAAMGNMGNAIMDQGPSRLEEASEMISKVHFQRQEQLGKEHPWTLWSLCYLAKVYSRRGFYSEAERMLVWGIGAGERSLGKDHIGVLMGLGELARVYSRQDRRADALSLTKHVVQGLEAAPGGPYHPDCVYGLYKLARLHEIQGTPDAGVEVCELALDRSSARLPPDFPLVKKLRSLLGRLEALGAAGL